MAKNKLLHYGDIQLMYLKLISGVYVPHKSMRTLGIMLYNCKKGFMTIKFYPKSVEFRYNDLDDVYYRLSRPLTKPILKYIDDYLKS